MSNPTLWLTFLALFTLSGLLNIQRGLRRPKEDPRRPVNLTLGISGLFWAAAAGMLRFVTLQAGYVFAAIAACIMVYAALLSVKTVK